MSARVILSKPGCFPEPNHVVLVPKRNQIVSVRRRPGMPVAGQICHLDGFAALMEQTGNT